MKVSDAIAEILKLEGAEFLSCFPTTIIIDTCASCGVRPVVCRQERVGVGIADGYSRVTNGKKLGVFAMQYGPGTENAFSGVATAYSDSVPVLLLPLGHQEDWIKEWQVKLASDEVPLNPYRVIWELMHTIDPKDAIVTHDAGSPRDQLVPFYQATAPRSYLGWGKSHGLGTGLGLAMGAKLAKPDKIAINFMGDAAFGMVGLDFETAARNNIPIITVVLNNYTMAIETGHMISSHELYRARDLGGNYADMGRAMGGYGERVEKPSDIKPAIQRAVQANMEEERPALLEFITGEEITFPSF